MKKSELRTLFLERRSSFSASQITEESREIADRFFESVDLSEVQRFHCFIPIEKFHEIDTLPIFHRVWQDRPAIETLAPRSNLETCEIESVRFGGDSALIQNRWGVSEPVGERIADAASIDMVLVPLLAYDKKGHRVGYGKGFYDRFLSECREDCMKIGLSFFAPVEEIGDVGERDIRLDLFVTPGGLVRPG